MLHNCLIKLPKQCVILFKNKTGNALIKVSFSYGNLFLRYGVVNFKEIPISLKFGLGPLIAMSNIDSFETRGRDHPSSTGGGGETRKMGKD